jgi:hypothetical protein
MLYSFISPSPLSGSLNLNVIATLRTRWIKPNVHTCSAAVFVSTVACVAIGNRNLAASGAPSVADRLVGVGLAYVERHHATLRVSSGR